MTQMLVVQCLQSRSFALTLRTLECHSIPTSITIAVFAYSPQSSFHAGPYYRRPLPLACIDFGSDEGRRIFFESLQSGCMNIYFKLAAQFLTQEEPAFCGLTTLVMTLNSLEVDPGQIWKGPWKWYHESMLNCCKPLNDIKISGINFEQFYCLARCNRLVVQKTYAPSGTAGDEKMATEALVQFRNVEYTCIRRKMFRSAVMSSVKSESHVIAVSYDRRVLKQTGTGHFSPIGGYHSSTDRVLILDVARFKYPPHWVELKLLFEAMQSIDPETKRPRGYVIMSLEPNSKDQVLLELQNSPSDLKYFFNKIDDWLSHNKTKLLSRWNSADLETPISTSFLDVWSTSVKNLCMIDFLHEYEFRGSILYGRFSCQENACESNLAKSIEVDLLANFYTLPEYAYFYKSLSTDTPKLAVLSVSLLYSWPFEMHILRENANDLLAYRKAKMYKLSLMAVNELSRLNKQLIAMLDNILNVQPQGQAAQITV